MTFYTKLLSFFEIPSSLEVAKRELAMAQLELLKAQTSAEFATAIVSYNTERIRRLSTYILINTK